MKPVTTPWMTAVVLCTVATAALAHHSYAMFDKRKSSVVEGSIAKVEWTNPHVFVWMYVRSSANPGDYELHAFESDSVNLLKASGWSKDSLKAGDKASIRYFPLRDGRRGGYLVWVDRSDGSRLMGDRTIGQITGVDQELERLKNEKSGGSK